MAETEIESEKREVEGGRRRRIPWDPPSWLLPPGRDGAKRPSECEKMTLINTGKKFKKINQFSSDSDRGGKKKEESRCTKLGLAIGYSGFSPGPTSLPLAWKDEWPWSMCSLKREPLSYASEAIGDGRTQICQVLRAYRVERPRADPAHAPTPLIGRVIYIIIFFWKNCLVIRTI